MARVVDKVPLAGQTKSVTSTDVGSPRESEAEDSSVSSKDQLRARVYSLLREVALCPCPLLLDLRRLLVVWFRINPIRLALFQNLIMLLLQFSL